MEVEVYRRQTETRGARDEPGHLGQRAADHLQKTDLFHQGGSKPINSAVVAHEPSHKKALPEAGLECMAISPSRLPFQNDRLDIN